MLSDQDLTAAVGRTAYGPDGGEIGTVEHFFLDDRTGDPTWVAVTTGLFGTRQSILPASDATFADGGLRVPVDREAVRRAPAVEAGDHLGAEEEARLRRHYGLVREAEDARPDALVGTDAAGGPAGTGRPTDDAMTRSEERLRISTEQVAAARVRVVKYVVTEEVQITVPLRREEIRIEELPLDATDDGAGALVTEAELADASRGRHAGPTPEGGIAEEAGLPEEIVLHKEVPVVDVRVVPTERVRLRIRTVQGEEQVSGQIRREEIAVDEQPAARPPEA